MSHGRVSKPIGVHVPVPGWQGEPFVSHAIAVVVHTVAEFGGAWLDEVVVVVAIGVVGYIARWLGTGYRRIQWVAKSITIHIAVVSRRPATA